MGNHSTALRPEVLSDLSETTAFTPEEIRQYYRAFIHKCDSSRMTIDLDKFKQLYTQLFPDGDSDRFAEQVFRVFDADQNGKLCFREFMLALSIQQKGSEDDKLCWLFNMFDLDGTGYISVEELETLIEALRRVYGQSVLQESDADLVSPREIATHIIAKADTSGDNQLSLKEFKEGSKASTTMQKLLKGVLQASSSPFSRRRTRTNESAGEAASN